MESDPPHADSATAQAKRRALRSYLTKIDTRLLLWLWLLNIFCQFDKQAIGSAKVVGLEADLGLRGRDFNVAATLFSVGFLAFDPISPLVVHKFGASKTLPCVVIAFGTVCGLTSLANSKTDLFVLRLFLGIAESGFAPAVLFLLSAYYPRAHLTNRIGWYYSASPAGGLIGGVMSSGISRINHARIAPWRWIYIVLGAITVLMGLVSFAVIKNSPLDCAYLSQEDRALVGEKDGKRDARDALTARDILRVLRDWQVWAFGVTCMLTSCGCSSINVFAPSIIKNYGFSASQAQALLAVPSIFGVLAMLSAAHLVRICRAHWVAAAATMCVAGVGCVVLIATLSVPARMVGLCLVATGSFANFTILPGFFITNYCDTRARAAVSAAFVPMIGGLSVFVASNAYTNDQQPRYVIGHSVNLGAAVLAVLMIVVLRLSMARRNRINAARFAEGEYFKYVY